MFKEPYIAMIKDWKGYNTYKKITENSFSYDGFNAGVTRACI